MSHHFENKSYATLFVTSVKGDFKNQAKLSG